MMLCVIHLHLFAHPNTDLRDIKLLSLKKRVNQIRMLWNLHLTILINPFGIPMRYLKNLKMRISTLSRLNLMSLWVLLVMLIWILTAIMLTEVMKLFLQNLFSSMWQISMLNLKTLSIRVLESLVTLILQWASFWNSSAILTSLVLIYLLRLHSSAAPVTE